MSSPLDSRHSVAILMDMIEEAAPLPHSHRKAIRFDVLDLWRDLTSERSLRQADYIGEPAKFAAYLRYFLPWNVVRLIPILAALELPEVEKLSLLDIGSGPLTLPIALWIARPDLRNRPLQITCTDRVRRVMETGLTIFDGLRLRHNAVQADLWKITLNKSIFPVLNTPDGERYHLVTAANVFNESFWKDKSHLDERAAGLSASLASLLKPSGRLLLVEPGDPRSGSMLAAIRESIILEGGEILGPCTHHRACPMPGIFMSQAYREENDGKPPITPVLMPKGRHKMPWCHFVLDQHAAPEKLLSFSETAGLPKDRLVASWLYCAPATELEAVDSTAGRPAGPAADRPHGSASWPKRSLRIISDAFRLSSGGYARYACGCTGYLLATGSLARLESGARVILKEALPDRSKRKDPKSGAIIVQADFQDSKDQAGNPGTETRRKPDYDPTKAKPARSRLNPAGQSADRRQDYPRSESRTSHKSERPGKSAYKGRAGQASGTSETKTKKPEKNNFPKNT